MIWQRLWPSITIAAAFVATADCAFAEPLHKAIWLDLAKPLSTQDTEVARLLKQPSYKVVFTGFRNGETVFPTTSRYFRQSAEFKTDVVQQLIDQWPERQIWLFLDCFQWSQGERIEKDSVFARFPDLIERAADGGHGNQGVFASPFHRETQEAMGDLVSEIAERYPTLKGIVLRCRLPLEPTLGYGEAAKIRFAKEKARNLEVVPLDRQAKGYDVGAWRFEHMRDFVAKIVGRYRTANPKGKLAVLGLANNYQLSWHQRANMMEDWLNWVGPAKLDELVLEGPITESSFFDGYRWARASMPTPKQPMPLTWAVSVTDLDKLTPAAVVKRVEHSGQELTSVLVRVQGDREAAWAVDFLKLASDREPFLTAADPHRLRNDPRLQSRIKLDAAKPTLAFLLDQIRKQTAIRLKADADIDSRTIVFGGVSWRGIQVWEAMDEIAQSPSIRGRWQYQDGSYCLISPLPPDARQVEKSGQSPKISDESRNPLIWSAVALFVIVIGMSIAIRLQKKKPPVENRAEQATSKNGLA